MIDKLSGLRLSEMEAPGSYCGHVLRASKVHCMQVLLAVGWREEGGKSRTDRAVCNSSVLPAGALLPGLDVVQCGGDDGILENVQNLGHAACEP